MSILAWIVIGIVAGWLAEKVMGRSHGLITNLIVGVLGAFLGGWLSSMFFGEGLQGFSLQSLVIAFGGACLLLFLLGLIKRR